MSDEAARYVEDVTGDDPREVAPIPVEVANAIRVQEFPARMVNTGQVPVVDTTQPTRVAAGLRSRIRLHLTVPAGAGLVWIGGHAGVTKGTGYPLAAGQTLELITSGDLFAVADAAPSVVCWLTQNRDG